MEDHALEEGETQVVSGLDQSAKEGRSYSWTTAMTLILLGMYKIYRARVGSMQIRNFKRMWEIISEQFLKEHSITIPAASCENRWRVLERNYKKYIDNKKQTGAGRKYFEFAEQMEEILGKKKNINPTVLLSASTIAIPSSNQMEEPEPGCSKDHENQEDPKDDSVENLGERKRKRVVTRVVRHRKNDILEKIRKDKEDRNSERLKFEKEKIQRLYELEVKKVQIKEEKNVLLKEKNEILREMIKQKQSLM